MSVCEFVCVESSSVLCLGLLWDGKYGLHLIHYSLNILLGLFYIYNDHYTNHTRQHETTVCTLFDFSSQFLQNFRQIQRAQ